jgi:predicted DNA-binding transcriptional regulator AlpA
MRALGWGAQRTGRFLGRYFFALAFLRLFLEREMQHHPKKHHLDRRADAIVNTNRGAVDDVLSTAQVADWLGISTQFLEIGRCKDYGPKFIRIGARAIRYRRADVVKWLEARTHESTAEYSRRRVNAEA